MKIATRENTATWELINVQRVKKAKLATRELLNVRRANQALTPRATNPDVLIATQADLAEPLQQHLAVPVKIATWEHSATRELMYVHRVEKAKLATRKLVYVQSAYQALTPQTTNPSVKIVTRENIATRELMNVRVV